MIPADIMLVSASTEDGNGQVMTANLDGETNLKLKTCKKEIFIPPLWKDEGGATLTPLPPLQQSRKLHGQIQCQPPNKGTPPRRRGGRGGEELPVADSLAERRERERERRGWMNPI